MLNKIYAMDFAFYNTLGTYDFAAQCEMVKEIGYDGIQRAIWDGTRRQEADVLATCKEKYGLDVAGIYIVLDLNFPEEHPHNKGILTLLENIEGCDKIDLAIRGAGKGIAPSSPLGDAPVTAWLLKALEICERRGIDLLLYTHIKFWMDQHSDAIRLCQQINHPNLGIVVTLPHWYGVDGKNTLGFLSSVYPYARKVHLSGSRRTPLGWSGIVTAQPLDSGELDCFAIVGTLKNMGYEGMFGYLGWDDGGDPYIKLKRSYDALRDMIKRADEHPHWTSHIYSPSD